MEQIHLEVVSIEAAKVLRTIGYDEYCDCYYHTDTDDPNDYEIGMNQHCNSDFKSYHQRISAPYVSEVILWLKHHKNIKLNVSFTPAESVGFDYSVSLYGDNNLAVTAKNSDYQLALREVIDKVLLSEDA